MARKAFGRYGGNSRNGTAEPPISPRVASTRPFRPTIWIEGGRFGTYSDWIGGRCAATHPTSERRGLLLFFLRDAAPALRGEASNAGSCRSLLLRPAIRAPVSQR